MKIATSHNAFRPAILQVFLLFFLVVCTGTALADAAQPGAGAPSKPPGGNLHVTSDEMVARQSNSMVEFKGNVRAVRDDAVLLAQSVKIFFYPSDQKKEGQDNVKEIVATGKVEYTEGERKAFADKAVYTTADERLVLTGEAPKLLTGKSYVTGRKITLFKLEERVVVESDGSKRVQAFFDSQDQGSPDADKKDKE